MAKEYILTESDICFILNEILSEYIILYPFNPRYKAQKKFMELMKKVNIPYRNEN